MQFRTYEILPKLQGLGVGRMTVGDVKEVTEVAKNKLKENGDVYSGHILAYISYLEKQIEKMKCCENCKHHSFWGDELKCNFFSYDAEIACLKDKHGWELAE